MYIACISHNTRRSIVSGSTYSVFHRAFSTGFSLFSTRSQENPPLHRHDIIFTTNSTIQHGQGSKLSVSQTKKDENSVTAVDIAKALASCQSPSQQIDVFPGGKAVRMKKPKAVDSSLKRLIKSYIDLGKPRLSALVVLSAMSAYALAPEATTLPHLLFLTVGTTLCSSSANAVNMGREWLYDRMMARTRNRPVARGSIEPRNAYIFAAACGVTGVAALYFGVNPTVAALGATNIVLYAWLYTSLKRHSICNTWIGAVVGAIPPLMGWASSSSLEDPGAWCLAALLYCWQFPHFMALSHNIRGEYQKAGHVMACWTNPALNARVALRHSIAMFPICFALAYFNVTDWFFTVDSAVVNGWLTYTAYRFWLVQKDNHQPLKIGAPSLPCAHARQLFWGSVIQLPAILVLAMIHKKRRWQDIGAQLGVYNRLEP